MAQGIHSLYFKSAIFPEHTRYGIAMKTTQEKAHSNADEWPFFAVEAVLKLLQWLKDFLKLTLFKCEYVTEYETTRNSNMKQKFRAVGNPTNFLSSDSKTFFYE